MSPASSSTVYVLMSNLSVCVLEMVPIEDQIRALLDNNVSESICPTRKRADLYWCEERKMRSSEGFLDTLCCLKKKTQDVTEAMSLSELLSSHSGQESSVLGSVYEAYGYYLFSNGE